jgi:hypothetical protein
VVIQNLCRESPYEETGWLGFVSPLAGIPAATGAFTQADQSRFKPRIWLCNAVPECCSIVVGQSHNTITHTTADNFVPSRSAPFDFGLSPVI